MENPDRGKIAEELYYFANPGIRGRSDWKDYPLKKRYYDKADQISALFEEEGIRKDERERIIKEIEKGIWYVDTRGYIALKPNATRNWLALKEGKKLGQ